MKNHINHLIKIKPFIIDLDDLNMTEVNSAAFQ